jgi:predicted nuclease with RNAse H fold
MYLGYLAVEAGCSLAMAQAACDVLIEEGRLRVLSDVEKRGLQVEIASIVYAAISCPLTADIRT